jgi:hypothetical protein
LIACVRVGGKESGAAAADMEECRLSTALRWDSLAGGRAPAGLRASSNKNQGSLLQARPHRVEAAVVASRGDDNGADGAPVRKALLPLIRRSTRRWLRRPEGSGAAADARATPSCPTVAPFWPGIGLAVVEVGRGRGEGGAEEP